MALTQHSSSLRARTAHYFAVQIAMSEGFCELALLLAAYAYKPSLRKHVFMYHGEFSGPQDIWQTTLESELLQ